MAGGQKKKNKGLAWLLTCILAVSAVFPQMVYADVMQEPETEAAGIEASDTASEEETVLLEGIRLNTTSLIMKTGEQKTRRWNNSGGHRSGRRRRNRSNYSNGRGLYSLLPSAGYSAGTHAGEHDLHAEQFRKQPL